MQEFEAIRPYQDDEVPGVIARLLDDPRLIHGAAPLMLPALASLAPPLAHRTVAAMLRWKARSIGSVDDFQRFLSRYFARLIRNTIAELTVSGLDGLTPGTPHLYVSNHRDITLDTALVNYTLHKAGFETPEAAVGDNLFSDPLAADLMRLNKSFMIERSVTGKRAIYRALTRTSHYIQHVLDAGHSVWIAQREGRSKDGFDRTDPALLKMVALAWRKDSESFRDLLERINLVPVAISYELDPCDRLKAHELAVLEREGSYRKGPNEDLTSIIQGLTGYKGRVHVHFGQPMRGDFADSDALAHALDVQIVRGLKVYPTQAAAARELAFTPIPAAPDWLPDVRAAYEQHLTECPAAERPFLLAGYGNLIRNRLALGIPVGATVSGDVVS